MSIVSSNKNYHRVSGSDGVKLATSASYNTCPAMLTDSNQYDQTMYGLQSPFGTNCQSAVLPQADRLLPNLVIRGMGMDNVVHPGYPAQGMKYNLSGYETVSGTVDGAITSYDIPQYGVDNPVMHTALTQYDGLGGMVDQKGSVPVNVASPDAKQSLPYRGMFMGQKSFIRPKVVPRH